MSHVTPACVQTPRAALSAGDAGGPAAVGGSPAAALPRRQVLGWLAAWPLAGLPLAGLAGCANRELTGGPPTQPPPAFSPSGQAPLADRWWNEFGDLLLSRHVEQALEGSFTLGVALQRLNAARALARREASDLLPDIDGIVTGNSTFGPGRDRTTIAWGLDAAYQVDLWGRIQSRVEAERLRAEATREDYQAVALTLAADVAATWFALIESRAQLELLNEQIETNRTGVAVMELRFGRGVVEGPDVLRQRQLVESTREQAVVAQARIEVLEHQLAVLLGQPPQSASYDSGTRLPELPPLPAAGLPSELLQRRPDVRRDYLAFLAADRDLASAISAQYPRISLTGSVLNAAQRPEAMFRDWFVSIGSQLIAPLLDGGQRRAEVARTAAVTSQRFNEYGQTMLVAFREVEDSLARERLQNQRIERLNAQFQLAERASQQLRDQYFLAAGADYLDFLSSIEAQQRLQREILSARLDLILIRIGLYLALAGGFDTRPYAASNRPAELTVPPDVPAAPSGPEELPPPRERAPETDNQ